MIRRYRFKLYPNAAQEARIDEVRLMHQRLYNAVLEERIDCYAKTGKTLTAFDQAKSVTVVRRDDPDYAALSSDSLALTCKRLDQAFKHFFRRAKQGAGASSGFPSFKSARFYPGWDCRENRKGWAMEPFGNRWRVRFKGIGPGSGGWIRVRGRFPDGMKEIRGCTVTLKAGVWWLSVVVEIERERACGHGSARLDWDIEGFAVTENAAKGPCGPSASAGISTPKQGFSQQSRQDTGLSPADTPALGSERRTRSKCWLPEQPADTPALGSERRVKRLMVAISPPADKPDLGAERRQEVGVPGLQRKIARCVRGSARRQRLGRQKARIQAHEARARREAMHRFTTDLVRRYDTVSVPDDEILDFTKSAKGTQRDHGAAVRDKAQANRALLDNAPGMTIATLAYKLAEAGGELLRYHGAEGTKHLARDLPDTAKTVRRANRKLKRKTT